MTEINRIVQLFEVLQHGDCWVGTNFRDALKGVDGERAIRLVPNSRNSIWLLVAHLIHWRLVVVNRLNGSDALPVVPDFRLPVEVSDRSWQQTLLDFEGAYHELRKTLLHFPEEKLHLPSIKAGQTHYQLIMGCLQHDAYHLGQIMLLKSI